jgi:putative flippase GtrA
MKLSKKFIMAIVGIAAELLVAVGYPELAEVTLSIAATIVAYLLSQGYIDAEKEKNR